MRSITSKTTRWRLRAARSWWLLGLVAVNCGLFLGVYFSEGAIEAVCTAGGILGMVVLWMVVSIRGDDSLDDLVDDASADEGADDASDDAG